MLRLWKPRIYVRISPRSSAKGLSVLLRMLLGLQLKTAMCNLGHKLEEEDVIALIKVVCMGFGLRSKQVSIYKNAHRK